MVRIGRIYSIAWLRCFDFEQGCVIAFLCTSVYLNCIQFWTIWMRGLAEFGAIFISDDAKGRPTVSLKSVQHYCNATQNWKCLLQHGESQSRRAAERTKNRRPTYWIVSLLQLQQSPVRRQTLIFFVRSHSVGAANCQNHTLRYFPHLMNMTDKILKQSFAMQYVLEVCLRNLWLKVLNFLC